MNDQLNAAVIVDRARALDTRRQIQIQNQRDSIDRLLKARTGTPDELADDTAKELKMLHERLAEAQGCLREIHDIESQVVIPDSGMSDSDAMSEILGITDRWYQLRPDEYGRVLGI